MRRIRRFACLLSFIAIVPLALGAQSAPTPPGAGAPPPADLQTASSLFAASDWKAAHAAYAAMAELQRAQRGRLLMTSAQLDRNAHLASLKAHARWTDVVAAFTLASQPCKADPRYRQFDFWIGDWDVRTTGLPPTGPAARNNITLEEGSCIVQEHWTGLGGGTGQSYNLFDRSMGKWRQTWVDSNGGQHDYVGELTDGNMVFEGTTPAPNGQLGRVPTRLTLFHVSADSVRQLLQVSPDSGRTWRVAYDFTYVRRKP